MFNLLHIIDNIGRRRLKDTSYSSLKKKGHICPLGSKRVKGEVLVNSVWKIIILTFLSVFFYKNFSMSKQTKFLLISLSRLTPAFIDNDLKPKNRQFVLLLQLSK